MLFCAFLAATLTAGCAVTRDGDADLVDAATSTVAPGTTAPPATIAGAPATATGAGGGGIDERIGPPGDGQPAVYPLLEGECFNEVVDDDAGAAHRMVQVPCEGPHDAEMFARHTLPYPPGAPFPGEQAVRRESYRACLARFGSYVGADYALSALRVAVLRPVASSWPGGDRSVTCSLYDGDLEPLVGTAWNSRR